MKNSFFKKGLAAMLSVTMLAGVLVPATVKAYAENTLIAAPINAEAPKPIQILSINDFHGALAEETKEKGKNLGMAKLVTAVKSHKQENPNTIVVSAGDNYQGSAMSNLTFGAPVSAMFKEMGIIASAVGNHEFDWGIEKTSKWEQDGGFKFLAANIVDKATGNPVSWADPYLIKEVDGVKIGFVGITTPQTSYQTAADRVKNVDFKDPKATAEKWAQELKSSGKADVVIVLAHVGTDQDKDTKVITGEAVENGLVKAKGVDAVISGHSHRTVAGYVDKMPVVQGYKNGRCIAKLTLNRDASGKVVEIVPEVEEVHKTKSSIVEDAATKASYDKFNKELDPIMSEKVGSTAIALDHDRSANGVSVLGYLVADIMRKDVDAQIGMTNSGGIRTNIPMGDITMGKMYEILPFDNTIVKVTLTGQQIKNNINNGVDNPKIGWIEIAGMTAEIDLSRPFGDRVGDMFLEDGTKIEMDKLYTVATNDFMATGGDGFKFDDGKDLVDSFVPMRDIIVKYIKANSPINYTFNQPFITKDLSSLPAKAPVATGALEEDVTVVVVNQLLNRLFFVR